MILSGCRARTKTESDGSNREMRTDWTSGGRLDVLLKNEKTIESSGEFQRGSDTGQNAGTEIKGDVH